jgi:hypothetical protein
MLSLAEKSTYRCNADGQRLLWSSSSIIIMGEIESGRDSVGADL